MATVGSHLTDSLVAAADLTGNQFFAVMAGSIANNVDLATGACGPAPVGILLNSPSTGEAAEVGFIGRMKLACDGGTAIGVRDFLTINASGKGAVTTSASLFYAMAWQALASGCGIIEVQWQPHGYYIGDNTP